MYDTYNSFIEISHHRDSLLLSLGAAGQPMERCNENTASVTENTGGGSASREVVAGFKTKTPLQQRNMKGFAAEPRQLLHQSMLGGRSHSHILMMMMLVGNIIMFSLAYMLNYPSSRADWIPSSAAFCWGAVDRRVGVCMGMNRRRRRRRS